MATALCTEDLVFRKGGDPQRVATVERTHADVDTHIPAPTRSEETPLKRNDSLPPAAVKKFLRDGVPPKGAVFVRWVHLEQAELISEDRLTLLHRNLFIGDVVSKGSGSTMSGIVLNVDTRCTLQPMGSATIGPNSTPLHTLIPSNMSHEAGQVHISPAPPPLTNIPASELRYEEVPAEDDLVLYRGWIGRVLSMACAVTVRLSDNCAVEVNEEVLELLTDHPDVPRVGDLVRTKKGNLRTGVWKYGAYNANTPPIGSVIATRPTSVEIAWLMPRLAGPVSAREPPILLERDDLESPSFTVYDRSRRPSAPSPERTVSSSEIETSIGLRVRFRDLPAACTKHSFNRIQRAQTLGYDVNVFSILSVCATATIQWQDLSVSSESAIALIPDTAIDDEHAAWPGEIAHSASLFPVPGDIWKTQPRKVGVVQLVKPSERMAVVRWCPSANVAYAKREPDPSDPLAPTRELVEGWVGLAQGGTEEVSLYDVECSGELNVRRGDIVLLSSTDAVSELAARDGDACWLGEIVDTWLDGRLLVRLGAADGVKDVPVRREEVVVAVRSDGTDGLDDLAEAQAAEGYADESDSEYGHVDGEGEWDDDMEFLVRYEDEHGEAMDVDDVEDGEWESDDGEQDGDAEEEELAAPDNATPDPTSKPDPTCSLPPLTNPPHPASSSPEPYAILDSPVPADHAFATSSFVMNPAHTKRLAKEHKILRTPGSLPQGIYIRTYESRLDLLRALFLGPSETPYAHCPFVIDFHLPGDYPHSPPQAYFHSWQGESGLGGTGRVNPNLYEDGKICLSLLGTWEGGAKGEGWSAVSTVLQVLVSILGLVLVREPYFNEAGYEPLAGLEASKRPSALYNERTLLRSVGFIVSAVSVLREGRQLHGLQGLEEEVRWFYLDPAGPQLLKGMEERIGEVLERSEGEEEGEIDGLSRVSKGACIPLRRVWERLKALQG